MGVARITAVHCLALNGEDSDCKVCVEMCPLAGSAISLDEGQEDGRKGPVVHEGACTGCGICEYYCPSGPTAIIVEPAERAG
jgi:NAD-dependent dihydropyrimidine dehydrogenase PreA subunit